MHSLVQVSAKGQSPKQCRHGRRREAYRTDAVYAEQASTAIEWRLFGYFFAAEKVTTANVNLSLTIYEKPTAGRMNNFQKAPSKFFEKNSQPLALQRRTPPAGRGGDGLTHPPFPPLFGKKERGA